MSKNIVIFSDGTGQKGGEKENTNVYKMFNMIQDRTLGQIAYYDPGLGSDGHFLFGNLYGEGFSKNIIDCYKFIFKHFHAGDKIYLFGFSRGAATVRSLANFIDLVGILPLSREDLIEEAFEIYKIKNIKKRAAAINRFTTKNHTMWTKIEFLGVFDTVAALGVPNKFLNKIVDFFVPLKFHSYELKGNIVHARHALSIDDKRKLFLPILFNKTEVQFKEEAKHEAASLKEVWFCGVHTDVGGGYQESEVSNISLDWMLKEAENCGIKIYEYNYKSYFNRSKADVNGVIHNEQVGFKARIYKTKERSWDIEKHGPPTIHHTVKNRDLNLLNEKSSPYESWILKLKNHIIEGNNN